MARFNLIIYFKCGSKMTLYDVAGIWISKSGFHVKYYDGRIEHTNMCNIEDWEVVK